MLNCGLTLWSSNWTKFSNYLYRLFDENYPTKISSEKSLDVVKPYISQEIKTLIRRNHRLQRLFSKNSTRYDTEYRSIKNLVISKIRKARDSYHERQLDLNSCDCKGLWRTLNNILQRNKFNQVQRKIVNDGCETADSSLIASELNEFYANVGKNLSANFNTSVCANDMLNFSGDLSPFTFCSEPVNEDVIQTVVMSLKNCSPGYDEMPTEYFYLMGNVITKIYNEGLLHGLFPKELSNAKVKSLIKSRNRKLVENYRPI